MGPRAAWGAFRTRLTEITKQDKAVLRCTTDIRPLKIRRNGSKMGGVMAV